jgi:hypothetical protein
VRGEDRLEKVRDGVCAKISRDVAEAKPTLGIAALRIRPLLPQRLGVAPSESDVLGENVVGACARVGVQEEQQAGGDDRERGIDRERAPILGQGLAEAAQIIERPPEIRVRFKALGLERERAPLKARGDAR